MPEQMLTPEDQMMQWITSKWVTKPIYVITELGIADILRDGPLSVDDLAEKTDTHAPIRWPSRMRSMDRCKRSERVD